MELKTILLLVFRDHSANARFIIGVCRWLGGIYVFIYFGFFHRTDLFDNLAVDANDTVPKRRVLIKQNIANIFFTILASHSC